MDKAAINHQIARWIGNNGPFPDYLTDMRASWKIVEYAAANEIDFVLFLGYPTRGVNFSATFGKCQSQDANTASLAICRAFWKYKNVSRPP